MSHKRFVAINHTQQIYCINHSTFISYIYESLHRRSSQSVCTLYSFRFIFFSKKGNILKNWTHPVYIAQTIQTQHFHLKFKLDTTITISNLNKILLYLCEIQSKVRYLSLTYKNRKHTLHNK